MAGEKREGGAAEELAAKLAQVEAGVSEREAQARAAEEEARAEHERLIQEMAEMIEGNKVLNQRVIGDRHEFASAYKRVEYAEFDRISATEKSIEQDGQTIADMEARLQTLGQKGEDVGELKTGLDELKQALEGRRAQLEEDKGKLEDLKKTNEGFSREQERAVQDQAGFAIETVLAQKEYAAKPEIEEAQKLPKEEKEALKAEVGKELAQRAEARQQEIWRQEDQGTIERNRNIIESVRTRFKEAQTETARQIQEVKDELMNPELVAEMAEKRRVIEDKLGGSYVFSRSKKKAGQEALRLIEELDGRRMDFYSRIVEVENTARSATNDLIIRYSSDKTKLCLADTFFYCKSKDGQIKKDMDKLEAERKALEAEIHKWRGEMLGTSDKKSLIDGELYSRLTGLFGGNGNRDWKQKAESLAYAS